MTQKIFSMAEAEAEADKVMELLVGLGFINPAVAGGWLRDADNGAPAKDMDVYIMAPTADQEALEKLAGAFYNSVGHTFKLLGSEAGAGEAEHGYEKYLTVFGSVDVPEGGYPIELIFTPRGYYHALSFDFSICDISRQGQGGFRGRSYETFRSKGYSRDIREKVITFQIVQDDMVSIIRNRYGVPDEDWDSNFARLVSHLKRIQAKYPDFTLVIDADRIWNQEYVKAYRDFIKEGLIEDARAVFPPERQIPPRDEVRLEDREAFVRDVTEATEALGRRYAIPRWLQQEEIRAELVRDNWFDTARVAAEAPVTPAPVETRTGRLRGRTQIQPGFADRLARSRAALAALAGDQGVLPGGV